LPDSSRPIKVDFNAIVDPYDTEERPPRLRLRPPEHPRDGMMYLDVECRRVAVYVDGGWLYLPLTS
jgi:hypothetical protein